MLLQQLLGGNAGFGPRQGAMPSYPQMHVVRAGIVLAAVRC